MRWRWCAEDFCRFYELLPQPHNGLPAKLEGFQRLIIFEIFATGRVELLVLIPKGQAKTTLMAALAIYHLLITRNANCYIGAADKIQADEMYRFAAHFVESEPELQARLKVLRGTRRIESRIDQGFILVLASDDSQQGGKRQGFNPTLALIDELHAHENDNLYVDMRSGLFKRNGILITITTAGWDVEGVLGKLRQSFLDCDQTGGSVQRRMTVDELGNLVEDIDRGRLTVARKSHRTAMLEWSLSKDDDWTDFEVVKLCNPASWVTIESLIDAFESLRPNVYKRYRCNLWTLAFESWLPEGAWDALRGNVPVVEHRLWNDASGSELDAYIASLYPKGVQVTGAADMARYRDCAAITLVGPSPNGLLLPRTIVWRSGGPDNPIPYGPVYRAARQIDTCYSLQALGLDQKYLDEMYDTLEGEGLPVESYPQSNERLCPADAALRQGILVEKAFEHDGDPILAAHVNAAVANEVNQGSGAFKLTKSKSNGPPIDAARAFSMAYDLAGDMPGDFWMVMR